jgi:hypothetical protein
LGLFYKEVKMGTRTKTIHDAICLLGEELRPHINKIFMTKEMLLEGSGDIAYGGDFDRFISGLYNVMDEATEAYDQVYGKLEKLSNGKTEAAH